jgi:hypothetical protein
VRYLNQKFPGQQIGIGGLTAWPLCSPDLYPLDSYLWTHLKLLVYPSPMDYMETLKKLNCGRFSDNIQYARNLVSPPDGNKMSSCGLYSGRRWTYGTFIVR